MDLFSNNQITNLLPYDGEVYYYGRIFGPEEASRFFDRLMNNINWKNDEVIIFGKHIITDRKIAWYGDTDFLYNYSNTTKQADRWIPELLELKKIAEDRTGAKFNSCLLNLYHNGNEGVSWHSDNEEALERHGVIASLSFGAERKFTFKHKKTQQTVSVILENGSLLTMQGTTQAHWLHSLPKTKKVLRPRINLTVRSMVTLGS
ncbi:MAG: alpha-ketoglutarate-dependent dioxygenase AlkB family protein [Flavipsychrobacter sp.]